MMCLWLANCLKKHEIFSCVYSRFVLKNLWIESLINLIWVYAVEVREL